MKTRPTAIARVHLCIFQCKRKQRNITNEKISMKLKKYDDTFIASETITMAVPSTLYPVPCTHGLTGRTWIVGLASWLGQRGMRLQRTSVWLEGVEGVSVCVWREGDVYQIVGFCVHADLNNFVGHFLGRFLGTEAIKTIISKFVWKSPCLREERCEIFIYPSSYLCGVCICCWTKETVE